ncbi:biotin transporter BioY [Microlunatus flavus]|uniref:Biotin transporter n=1 Tax=Microlunatus flavus TaxID=1036181 RepID=A0A1H8Z458_9ACTN|nr:biotin transporter BioY [Microlunatus flavus]SEP59176.1 biotin transport system substrate-specific component [Microlunatus flavus]
MSLVSASPRTLGDVVPGGLVRNVALVVGGTLFVALSALVQIPLPFTPVPLSLQTFAVLLVGASLGSRRGAASMALYLLAGVAGVPWFAAHQSGWAFASFGYVVGFVAAGWLAGRLAEAGADRQVVKNTGLLVLGNVVIYAFGVTGLIAFTGRGVGDAVAKGVVPFLIGDVVKIAVAAALLPAAWKLVGSRRG